MWASPRGIKSPRGMHHGRVQNPGLHRDMIDGGAGPAWVAGRDGNERVRDPRHTG